jgi:hypothetical protein
MEMGSAQKAEWELAIPVLRGLALCFTCIFLAIQELHELNSTLMCFFVQPHFLCRVRSNIFGGIPVASP